MTKGRMNDMKLTRKLLAALLALAMLMSACAFADETAAIPADTVVATVNGEDILKSDLDAMYQDLASDGYTVTYAEALENVIAIRIIEQQIRQKGFDVFTPEEEAALTAEANTLWETEMQRYVTYYLSEDTEEARAQLHQQAEEYYRSFGYSPEKLVDNLKMRDAQNRLLKDIVSEDSVTDEDVVKQFEATVSEQQAMIGDEVGTYELYKMYMNYDFWYMPAGYRSVLHILMRPDSALLTAYSEAVKAYDQLKETFDSQQAAQDDATEEAAEAETEAEEAAPAEEAAAEAVTEAEEAAPAEEAAAEAVTETEEAAPTEEAAAETVTEAEETAPAEEAAETAQTEEAPAQEQAAEEKAEPVTQEMLDQAQAKVDEALAAIIASKQTEIDTIEKRLADGEDFAAVARDYNEDPGLDLEKGYEVHKDSIMWDPVFTSAAFSDEMQQPGDHSRPVVGSYGIHILYYLNDIPAGAIELTDELRTSIREDLMDQKRSEALMKMYQENLKIATVERNADIINRLDGGGQDVQIDFEADDADAPEADAEPAEDVELPVETDEAESEQPTAETEAEPTEAPATEEGPAN